MKKEKKCGIYKIENIINDKVYIGQSTNIYKRFYTHRYKAYCEKETKTYNLHFYAAIRKYGKNSFKLSIIEECSKSDLDRREMYWIKYYKSNQKEFGYNLSDGGKNIYTKNFNDKNNITSKEKRVEEIRKLLLMSSLSIQEIARKFNMNVASITNINRGHSWHCESITYPIRDTRKKHFYFCSKCGKKISNKYSKLCKKCDGERQQKEKGNFIDIKTLNEDFCNHSIQDLSKKYNVSLKTIYRWIKKYDLKPKNKEE